MSTPMDLWAGGNFLGGVTLIYTSVLGPLFFGLLVMIIILPIYFKTNSIVLPLGLALLLSGLFEAMLPAAGVDLARFIAIAGIAAALFFIVTRGR